MPKVFNYFFYKLWYFNLNYFHNNQPTYLPAFLFSSDKISEFEKTIITTFKKFLHCFLFRPMIVFLFVYMYNFFESPYVVDFHFFGRSFYLYVQ